MSPSVPCSSHHGYHASNARSLLAAPSCSSRAFRAFRFYFAEVCQAKEIPETFKDMHGCQGTCIQAEVPLPPLPGRFESQTQSPSLGLTDSQSDNAPRKPTYTTWASHTSQVGDTLEWPLRNAACCILGAEYSAYHSQAISFWHITQ